MLREGRLGQQHCIQIRLSQGTPDGVKRVVVMVIWFMTREQGNGTV